MIKTRSAIFTTVWGLTGGQRAALTKWSTFLVVVKKDFIFERFFSATSLLMLWYCCCLNSFVVAHHHALPAAKTKKNSQWRLIHLIRKHVLFNATEKERVCYSPIMYPGDDDDRIYFQSLNIFVNSQQFSVFFSLLLRVWVICGYDIQRDEDEEKKNKIKCKCGSQCLWLPPISACYF